MKIQILNATTIGEIDAAFAALARERPDALFVGPDGFFTSRRGQFATLTAVNKIPATYSNREYVAAGGLMSYGTDLTDVFHQVGVYTGKILKGAKPADLPVVQSTKQHNRATSPLCASLLWTLNIGISILGSHQTSSRTLIANLERN